MMAWEIEKYGLTTIRKMKKAEFKHVFVVPSRGYVLYRKNKYRIPMEDRLDITDFLPLNEDSKALLLMLHPEISDDIEVYCGCIGYWESYTGHLSGGYTIVSPKDEFGNYLIS